MISAALAGLKSMPMESGYLRMPQPTSSVLGSNTHCTINVVMKCAMRLAAFALSLCFAGVSHAATPVIDNERVTVWDITSPVPHPEHDFVTVYLASGKAHKRGDAFFTAKGAA